MVNVMYGVTQYNRATPCSMAGRRGAGGCGATYLHDDVKVRQNPLKSVAKLFRSPLFVVGVSVSLCSLSLSPLLIDDVVIQCNPLQRWRRVVVAAA